MQSAKKAVTEMHLKAGTVRSPCQEQEEEHDEGYMADDDDDANANRQRKYNRVLQSSYLKP